MQLVLNLVFFVLPNKVYFSDDCSDGYFMTICDGMVAEDGDCIAQACPVCFDCYVD